MGNMDGLMQMVAICQEFHWTYQDYNSQPAWFLTLIIEKLTRDRKREQLESRKRNG